MGMTPRLFLLDLFREAMVAYAGDPDLNPGECAKKAVLRLYQDYQEGKDKTDFAIGETVVWTDGRRLDVADSDGQQIAFDLTEEARAELIAVLIHKAMFDLGWMVDPVKAPKPAVDTDERGLPDTETPAPVKASVLCYHPITRIDKITGVTETVFESLNFEFLIEASTPADLPQVGDLVEHDNHWFEIAARHCYTDNVNVRSGGRPRKAVKKTVLIGVKKTDGLPVRSDEDGFARPVLSSNGHWRG